jgi:acetylornithine deacetylase/succinyl-diaminopimelate desuccinylase-like protein
MGRRFLAMVVVPAFVLSWGTAWGQTRDGEVAALLATPAFKQAAAFFDADHDRFVRELIMLTEIPAPSFKEQKRAEAVLGMLRELGLVDVEIDAEGNVMGLRKGTGGGPVLAVLAHLDTVFPEGTNVTVRREGTRLMAPGIGDDTTGVAQILALVRAMDAAGIRTRQDILLVGNVGEEGPGNLRGVRYLLQQGKYKDRIRTFIAIDGGDQSAIVTGALGSRRYRVTFKGPGGHSYGAFGLVNPAFAMGNAIDRFSRVAVPAKPKTTLNVGIVAGGSSVNSIPGETFMDVDMRSESPQELAKLDQAFLRVVREAVDEENRTRSTTEGRIEAETKLLGDRPSGETPATSELVQQAAAVVKAFGMTPRYEIGSTDSNIPISMGMPAITIGRGKGGRGHSLDEWVDVEKASSVKASQVALAIVLAAAGLQ